ncbi:MAG: methyltransferase [Humidesulfovibrio sp.]|uniref:tRNA1(Val) (adenine(37)-N6)-methyltransferase n=1 Tax=Humidesulfovibrio sp. TaxID=2910988 RepID=UPI002734B428|nr:methyltransferase [Humidesulfovibrio sp.]MDP2848509.1 methyltransferase [Humidesulfovibrio sp.]
MQIEAAHRRARFPRGLAQPEGGFRFGADTLLLSAFAHAHLKPGHALTGLDLGTGCGAASIGLLLLRPDAPLRLTGIDTGPEMIAAAQQNAEALDLSERFTPLLADAQDYSAPNAKVDFALANPPFRAPGTGKACPDNNKHRARFEGPGGFAAFAACASRNLRKGGHLFLVHLAERLPELICALDAAGLNTRRLLPVQGSWDKPPRLALVLAVRGQGHGLTLDCPLALYTPQGKLTAEAIAFCPHLAANPSRNASGASP